jgi:hypothetical protein
MSEAGDKEKQVRALREARAKRWKQQARATATATVAELRQTIADVTKKTAPAVTKSVTKNVTKKKRGRPSTGKAMSGAERIRRLRERRIKNAK